MREHHAAWASDRNVLPCKREQSSLGMNANTVRLSLRWLHTNIRLPSGLMPK